MAGEAQSHSRAGAAQERWNDSLSNDGLRYIIDRRGNRYYWSFNDLGEEYKSQRGYETPLEAVSEADQYRRMIAGRYFKAKRSATSPSP